MFRSTLIASALGLGTLLPPTVIAAPIAYLDEADFLADLSSLGHSPVHEGFEDDAVWGSVRTTITGGFLTAPSISRGGVTWESNNPLGGITTSSGAARTGDWGLFAYPHGAYANPGVDCTTPGDCGDGFIGSAAGGELLFGIGGWIQTNTPPVELGLYLDGYAPANRVDFGETCDAGGENCVSNSVFSTSRFFGVIDSDGFSSFEFRELEGTSGEQKFIYGDDFHFAGSATGVVPLPGAAWLFGAGLLGLTAVARRR